MNNRLRHFLLSSNYFLRVLYFFKRLQYKNRFFDEIKYRKNCDLFDYKRLSSPLKIYPIDYCPDNNLYGLSAILKEYAGVPFDKSINYCMEHGLYFGEYSSKDLEYYPKKFKIITLGSYRKNILLSNGCKRDITMVGSYIQYAKPLLNVNEVKMLKKKYGKILLVFPTHSIIGASVEFSIESFITEINRVRKNFDSVFVCLYFVDCNNTLFIDRYKAEGYIIVTSGHKYDVNFMNRQRTLIELSDMTMSNDVGTHVGYSVVLNKPHYIFNQNVNVKFDNKSVEKKHIDNITQEKSKEYQFARNEVFEAFSVFSETITDIQKKVVSKYWGTEKLLPSEVGDLLK